MVAAECDSSALNCRYVIRPNRSLSWRGTVVFFWSIFVVCMGIALSFAFAGLWMVLPFAGLELLALGVCLYLTCLRSSRCEVISVDRDTVKIESGRRRAERCNEFGRGWVQVRLQTSPYRWYPSRLILGSHGREVEVGAFLSETERTDLARELGRVISAI